MYTKLGVPVAVSGTSVYSPSGRQFGRISGKRVFSPTGRSVATVAGNRLIYRPIDAAVVGSPFAFPNGVSEYAHAAATGD